MGYLILTLDCMAVEPTFECMPRRGFVDRLENSMSSGCGRTGYLLIGVLDFVCAVLRPPPVSEKPSSITFRWAILPWAVVIPVLLSLSEGSSAI